MEQIIFVKYSNERNRKFAIRTEILEDEVGKRSVKKTSMYPEGQVHLKEIGNYFFELTKVYDQSILECNQCEIEGNSIRFEYVEAKTLEEKLDKLIEAQKVNEAVQILKNYLLLIDGISNKETFQMTDKFCEIFGEVYLPEGLRCSSVTNIDMVCGNILVEKDRWIMIDYEWTFSFPIPIHYLLYRVIHYYQDTHSIRKQLDEFDLYSWAGIKKEECEAYMIMEKNFQKYITQGHVPMREMYADISPGSYQISHLVSKEQLKRSRERIQVFYSFGDGFHEENSKYYAMSNGYIDLKLDLPTGVEEIRIDPGDGIGICKVKKMSYNMGEIQAVSLSEGVEKDGNVFIMSRMDPQIYLGKVPQGATRLFVEMEVITADADCVEISEANNAYIQLLKKQNDVRQHENAEIKKKYEQIFRENEQKQLLLRQKEKEMAEMGEKISQMENTKIWKAYRKYRKVRERN